MGYFVRVTHSTTVIPLAVKDEVLKIWKDLNHPRFNHKKLGGDGGNSKWYSWMDEDYDLTVQSCDDVLYMLGFQFEVIADGSILVQGYDNKSGQEEFFFSSVAHLIEGGMEWAGEDGEKFSWKFDGQPRLS
jgi:hypothetical protein